MPCKQIQIIGFPYEEGTYWRKGTKHGPQKVREHLKKLREFSVNSNCYLPFDLTTIDLGDITLDPYSKKNSLQSIEEVIQKKLEEKIRVISIGGDHSITLPIIRAYSRKYENFGIIQLDAHSDTFEAVNGYKYHHGAVIKNIVDERLVSPSNIYQFGLRGQVRKPGLTYAESQGVNMIKMREFKENQFSIKKFIKNTTLPYYLSIDIDVVDPAYAPGTGTPVPGGLTSYELLELIREINSLQIIGVDLVEVAPIYDNSEITSLLAANIIFEVLCNL